MKKTKLYLLLFFAFLTSFSYSQKIKVLEGSLDALSGEKFFNIEYDYSNMAVGKYENEQDYIDRKVKDYNEKEPGRGDTWKKNWIDDRKARFQPQFEELLNKNLEKVDVFVGNEKKGAKYTIIVQTVFTEPGFNIYVSKKPAQINVVIKIVETENRDNVVCEIVSKNNLGRTYGMGDYDTGLRISEAYAKCGKELGKFFSGAWK